MAAPNVLPVVNRSNSHAGDIHLLVGTLTPQKVTEYSAIAWANEGAYPLRATVAPLNEVVIHHSPIEGGESSNANAGIKFDDVAPAFHDLREGQVLHDSFKKRLRQSGFEFHPKNVIFLTEDSTIAVPADVWEIAGSELAQFADSSLVYTDTGDMKGDIRNIEGIECITIPDGGLIWTATGYPMFFNALRKAAHKLGYEELPIYDQASCNLTRLSDPPGAPPAELTVQKELFLFAPKGLGEPLQEPDALLTYTNHYLCTPEYRSRPTACYRDKYLVNESTRKLMFDQIMLYAARDYQPPTQIIDFRATANQTNQCPRAKAKRGKQFRIVKPAWEQSGIGDSNVERIGHFTITAKSLDTTGRFIDALSMKFDLGHKKNGLSLLEHPDGLLSGPFDATDSLACAQNKAIMDSFVVAKQFDPAIMCVPYVVMNFNGCYDAHIKSYIGYTTDGYNKDFLRTPLLEGRNPDNPIVTAEGVKHTATCFMDIVSGTDLKAMVRAAEQIFEARLEHYHRLELPQHDISDHRRLPEGTPKPNGVHAVTVFSSASSDKRILNQYGEDYARFLAENGIGLITGGFDQHTGASLIKGYRDGNGRWFAAFSTDSIVKVETIGGHLPPADFWRITHAISPRIMDLIGYGDSITELDGGSGTGQEDAVLLTLKLLGSDLVKDKPLTLFDPNNYRGSFYSPLQPTKELQIDATLGRGAYELMRRDHDAFGRIGVFLATDMAELKRRTLDHTRAHTLRHIQSMRRGVSALQLAS